MFLNYKNKLSVVLLALLTVVAVGQVASAEGSLSLAHFLPKNYATDGSVSYQKEFQQAIDAAVTESKTLIVPPMKYLIDETGLQLKSGLNLQLTGAVFLLAESCDNDGAVFSGHDVADVTIVGGEIVGRNDVWADGVNIRGIHITGKSSRINIQNMYMHDLSSNGIGLIGDETTAIHDVTVSDVIIDHCCNRYPEYLSDEKWEKGSTRYDQGSVAYYFVNDFTVRGCRFERSRSDGTHFYKCQRGQIVNNRIYRAKMGGYFLEGCIEVVGSGNVIRENGSRGVTIERGSINCIFSGNTVSQSGREGLWAPNCRGLVVTGNLFDRNGRKPNGKQQWHVWNANITINDAHGDPSKTATEDYVVANNLIYSTTSQVAAIRVKTTATTSGIVIQNNVLRGEQRLILLQGPKSSDVVLNQDVGRMQN